MFSKLKFCWGHVLYSKTATQVIKFVFVYTKFVVYTYWKSRVYFNMTQRFFDAIVSLIYNIKLAYHSVYKTKLIK